MDSAAVFGDDGKGCGNGGTCENSDRVRGVCPAGWHLPDSSEIEILLSVVGGKNEAGIALKTSSGWYNSGNGADSYGFSALPAGGYIIAEVILGAAITPIFIPLRKYDCSY